MMTTSIPPPSPPVDFLPLGSTVFLYTPFVIAPSTTRDFPPNAPTLVIICTWAGGATASRISKYTKAYQKLLPIVPILLIEVHTARIALMPFPLPLGHLMNGAVPAIQSHLKSVPGGKARVHLHLFSHGGCDSALNLIHRLHKEGIKLPFTSVVFDSCPLELDFWASWRALRVNLPTSTIPRAILGAPIMFFVGQTVVLHKLHILADGNQISRELSDPETLGNAKRLYLLGKGDEVMNWREAWGHAANAKDAGVNVTIALFDGSHCALIVGADGEDKRRYWKAVSGLWEKDAKASKL